MQPMCYIDLEKYSAIYIINSLSIYIINSLNIFQGLYGTLVGFPPIFLRSCV